MDIVTISRETICFLLIVARNGVKFSESGAAMEIENVFLSIGNNDIISDINWSIMPKERWALVGRNGAGHIYLPYLGTYILLYFIQNIQQENQHC